MKLTRRPKGNASAVARTAPITIGAHWRKTLSVSGAQLRFRAVSAGPAQWRPILWPIQAPIGGKANHGRASKTPFWCRRKSKAERAGLKVSELNAEITVDTAMVRANCRKNWPVIPVMNAQGTK